MSFPMVTIVTKFKDFVKKNPLKDIEALYFRK